MPTVREHNIETGEVIDREMTAEELLQSEQDAANFAAEQEAIAAADAKKAAILAALADATGYTPDELREALKA